MIVAAAICPSTPLLVAGMTGQQDILPELRAASMAAVARLLEAGPDVVAVAGPAEATMPWDPAGEPSLTSLAPALYRSGSRPASDNSKKRDSGLSGTGLSDGALPLPLALGIGAVLLDEAGYAGPRLLFGIAGHEPAPSCLALGREIAASAARVALLAVGDGTARRSAAGPGHLDERAAPFDEAAERAVRDADLPAIAALDPALAADLLAVGRPAWQALAGALSPAPPERSSVGRPQTQILYSDAPFGVAYLVATLIPAGQP